MIIYSEILHKKFDTPEQCREEEENFLAQKAAEDAEKTQKINDIKALILSASESVKASDEAIEKAAIALFDYRAKHGAGEITIECSESDTDIIGRTISMVCHVCDIIELKRHAEMQNEDE